MSKWIPADKIKFMLDGKEIGIAQDIAWNFDKPICGIEQVKKDVLARLRQPAYDVIGEYNKFMKDLFVSSAEGEALARFTEFYMDQPPTMQVFTKGGGTYTAPKDAVSISFTMIGGGGGGGGSGCKHDFKEIELFTSRIRECTKCKLTEKL